MAVTLNVVGVGTASGGAVATASPVVAAGSNIGAVIQVEWRDVATAVDSAFISSVSLTGFAVPAFVQVASGAAGNVEAYASTAGTAGAQTATVNWSTSGGPADVLAEVGCQVFNNVNQSTPTGAVATGGASSNAVSATVVGTIAGSMVSNGAMYDNVVAATAVVGGGTTQDWNAAVGSIAQGRVRALGSHRLSAGGNVAMTWALSGVRAWASNAVEVLEASATAVRDPILATGIVVFPR